MLAETQVFIFRPYACWNRQLPHNSAINKVQKLNIQSVGVH